MKEGLLRITIAFYCGLSIFLAIATTASAHPPHNVLFANTTDSCVACHRTHTAPQAKMLKDSSQYDLCIGCHDGTGANTNVATGVYLGSDQGTEGTGLRGGGFEQSYMDSDTDGTLTPANITSKHTIGGSSMTAWGSGSSGNGESVALECSNCHNPHGNNQYRILRPRPNSLSGWESLPAANITAGITDNYTIDYNGNNYRQLSNYTAAVLDNIGDWCGQCHTRYPAGAGSGSDSSAGGSGEDTYQAGTSPFIYRHQTETLTGECLACHVAHGTSANMTGHAAVTTWPDGTSSIPWQDETEGQHSRLLTIDNRGVCMQCHSNGSLVSN